MYREHDGDDDLIFQHSGFHKNPHLHDFHNIVALHNHDNGHNNDAQLSQFRKRIQNIRGAAKK